MFMFAAFFDNHPPAEYAKAAALRNASNSSNGSRNFSTTTVLTTLPPVSCCRSKHRSTAFLMRGLVQRGEVEHVRKEK